MQPLSTLYAAQADDDKVGMEIEIPTDHIVAVRIPETRGQTTHTDKPSHGGYPTPPSVAKEEKDTLFAPVFYDQVIARSAGEINGFPYLALKVDGVAEGDKETVCACPVLCSLLLLLVL